MANAKEIKRKIGSIKNTWKITKAMELISTIKMKKAQDLALEKRNFVLEMLKIFLRIENRLSKFPIFSAKNKKEWKTLWIIISSNKWLCWGYNVSVMKKVNSYVKETKEEIDFISIWKKSSQFIAKTWNNLIADFSDEFTDTQDPVFTKKISSLVMDKFLSWKYNKVVIFYNFYVNTIKQIAVSENYLPIGAEDIKKYLYDVLWDDDSLKEELKNSKLDTFYEIEPSPYELALEVIPMILDMMFFDTLIDAKASEHSARMIAMKNAKDAAENISSTLTLKYNKARQASITSEIIEISSWVEALKDA